MMAVAMFENTIEVRVGRLVEIRVSGYASAADVHAMLRRTKERTGASMPNSLAVTAADWRNCAVLAPDAAEEVGKMLRGANAVTERAALLYSDRSPTAVMQFMRLLADAKNPNRRMFSKPEPMAAWLSEVLSDEEARRLREFLGLRPSRASKASG